MHGYGNNLHTMEVEVPSSYVSELTMPWSASVAG